MNKSLIENLIQATRLQIKALEQALGMLLEQLAVPEDDGKLRCPQCKVDFTETNDASTMGNSDYYICHSCGFRGTVC